MTIVAVIPSRGRPARAREAIAAMRERAALVSTSIVLAVDADDPCWPDYAAMTFDGFGSEVSLVTLRPEESGNLVRATNTVAMRIADADPECIIGNLGDDHLVRTKGWDKLVAAALERPGIAYGDDLLQGEHLPTAPFISASIVLALGWYALPVCQHLYVDDAWRELGREAGVLRYIPELTIEHVHPGANKAEWDEGYERANNARVVEADKGAYRAWLRGRRFRRDLNAVRRVVA